MPGIDEQGTTLNPKSESPQRLRLAFYRRKHEARGRTVSHAGYPSRRPITLTTHRFSPNFTVCVAEAFPSPLMTVVPLQGNYSVSHHVPTALYFCLEPQ